MHSELSSQLHHKITHSREYGSSVEKLKSLKNLLDVYHGSSMGSSKYSFTKVLNSEELLLALLRSNKAINYLNDHPEFSLSVVKALSRFSRVPWDIVCSLALVILNSTYLEKEDAKLLLWSIKDSVGFPSKIGSLLIKEEPKWVESHILGIYLSQTDLTIDQWKEEINKWLVTWSWQSSEVFIFSIEVLNHLLINAKFKQVILKIIRDFVQNVRIICERNGRDFVMLYPLKCQSLVSMLTLEPEFNPCRPNLIQKLQNLEDQSPITALMLYSHFPEWLASET